MLKTVTKHMGVATVALLVVVGYDLTIRDRVQKLAEQIKAKVTA